MTATTLTYWPELHPDLGLVWRTSDGGNFELEWHAQLYAVRGCPQTTADECAFVAERAAAGRLTGLPPCPIHWRCEGFNVAGRWVDCDRTDPHGHGIVADGLPVCPSCGSDDLQLWADDGEADDADWWECPGCKANGSVAGGQLTMLAPDDVHRRDRGA